MWLYPSITTENTIQQLQPARYFSASAKKKKIITCNITTIKKYLLTASIQICRLAAPSVGTS
jgi:hypothetical protein